MLAGEPASAFAFTRSESAIGTRRLVRDVSARSPAVEKTARLRVHGSTSRRVAF
jgi:hypothetical protein